MNKLIVVLFAVLAVQFSFATNVTTGTTCGGTGINFTNCAYCDAASSTYCTNCNAGYQLTGLAANAAGNAAATTYTGCGLACAAPCVYCTGTLTAGTGLTSSDQRSSGNAASMVCQLDNKATTDTTPALTASTAYCKPTTTTGTGATTTFYTPSAISAANTYSCYSCFANCANCKPATGSPATASPTTCNQCVDGYFLDTNSTVTNTAVTPNTNSTVGSACTACGSISSVNGTTSNSAYIVIGTCNKCVNKTGCINATCTRFQGTTAGTGSADTTSYTFDVSKQMCVAKSGSRLAVAVIAAVAVSFVALF